MGINRCTMYNLAALFGRPWLPSSIRLRALPQQRRPQPHSLLDPSQRLLCPRQRQLPCRYFVISLPAHEYLMLFGISHHPSLLLHLFPLIQRYKDDRIVEQYVLTAKCVSQMGVQPVVAPQAILPQQTAVPASKAKPVVLPTPASKPAPKKAAKQPAAAKEPPKQVCEGLGGRKWSHPFTQTAFGCTRNSGADN